MTLEELYARYEAAIESRAEVAQAKAEWEKAEAICNAEIAAAQEAIKEWYVKQNMVAVIVAENEKDF